MTIIFVCRFVDYNEHSFNYTEDNPFEYKAATIIADGLFIWLPVFVTMRLLLLFRAFKNIGLLQISFSKMFDDIFAWIAILLTIIVGFSIGFNLLGSTALTRGPEDVCEGTLFDRMGSHLGNSLWEVSWVMFTGPDPDDIQDMRACVEFNWFIHVMTYLLFAILALMIVVVLVNLLIAMMSKTFDKTCDESVREIEWTFHMINLNVKFIRRDFVAPVPMNLSPDFYKHLLSEHAFWRRKESAGEVHPVKPDTIYSNSVDAHKSTLAKNFLKELDQGEILQRNEDYNEVVGILVQRYKRKYL